MNFWDDIYAWSLGLGFVLLLTIITMIWCQWYYGKVYNPFGPFIRAFERRQQHNQYIAKMKIRAEMIRAGMDPEYVKFMEKELQS